MIRVQAALWAPQCNTMWCILQYELKNVPLDSTITQCMQATSTSTLSSTAKSKMSSPLPRTLICIIIVVQLQNDQNQPHNAMPVFTIQLHNNMSSTTLQLLDNMSSTTLQLYNSTTIWAPQFHNSTTIWAPQLETQAAPQQYELRTVVSTRPSVVNSLAALVIIFTALATCVFVKVIAAIIVIAI